MVPQGKTYNMVFEMAPGVEKVFYTSGNVGVGTASNGYVGGDDFGSILYSTRVVRRLV